VANARTVTELIAKIQEWFPNPDTLVYLPSGIMTKESVEETCINYFDELPADWVVPDELFESLCSEIEGYDGIHEQLWEGITETTHEVVKDYLDETSKEQELWEA